MTIDTIVGSDKVVGLMHIYFNRYEMPVYSTERNTEGMIYAFEARRQFTDYYLDNIPKFYDMLLRHYIRELRGAL